ncbi:hypothetical protein E3P92_03816 [Wallemia ichthyophaga]|nr:hypothetical protein E3P92_03816 [Wallemia ichthyophaga]
MENQDSYKDPFEDAKSPFPGHPGESVERSAPSKGKGDVLQPSNQKMQPNDTDELIVKMIKKSSSTAERLKQLDGLLKMAIEKILLEKVDNDASMREMLDPLTTQMNIELDAFEARINNNDELKELIVATKIRDADNEDLSSDESKLLENLNSIREEYGGNVRRAQNIINTATKQREEAEAKVAAEEAERIERVNETINQVITLNKQLTPLINLAKSTVKATTHEKESIITQLSSLVEQAEIIVDDAKWLDDKEEHYYKATIELSRSNAANRSATPEDYRLIDELKKLEQLLNVELVDIRKAIENLSGELNQQVQEAEETEKTLVSSIHELCNTVDRTRYRIRPILRMMKDVIDENESKKEVDIKELNDRLRPLINQSLGLHESALAEIRQFDPKKELEKASLARVAVGQGTTDDVRLSDGIKDIESQPLQIEEAKKFLKHHERIQDEADALKDEEQKKIEWLINELSDIVETGWSRIKPLCDMIDDAINTASQIPDEEMDEQKQKALSDKVIPLCEQAQAILYENQGQVEGFDRHAQILKLAKQHVESNEASAEENRLAEKLTELTETVARTIENAKSKLANMQYAKRDILPILGLLSNPITQILGAVGLLLTGVLNLVGTLLSGLGLGGVVNGILRGLRLDKILYSVTGIKLDSLRLK